MSIMLCTDNNSIGRILKMEKCDTPVLSVIVPVYNVEKWLPACIESILGQTLRDLELILVDDGSPDGSGAICDRYAAQDSRVKVIHKQNGGVGSARNAGLDVARGKYLTFVDGDDELGTPQTYEDNIKILEQNNRIGILDIPITEMKTGESRLLPQQERLMTSKTKMMEALAMEELSGYLFKIFRREPISGLRFREDLKMAEDGVYIIDCIDKAGLSVYFSVKGMYNYNYNSTSASRNVDAMGWHQLFSTNLYALDKLVKCDGVSQRVAVNKFFVMMKCLLMARLGDNKTLDFEPDYRAVSSFVPDSRCIIGKGIPLKLKIWLLFVKLLGVKGSSDCYVRLVRWRSRKS